MKMFDAFNIDDKEKLFLELAHLDELEIRFDFIEYKNSLYYFYKKNCLFDQNKKRKIFWINYSKIWRVIEKKFDINDKETKDIMSSMVEKHFKLKKYSTTYKGL